MRPFRVFYVAAANCPASLLGPHTARKCFQAPLIASGKCVSSHQNAAPPPGGESASFAGRQEGEKGAAPRAPLRPPAAAAADAIAQDQEWKGAADEEHRHGEYRKAYSKVGYDFVENMRTSHPNFVINQTRMSLLFYSVAACTVVMYVVYYFTTYTYVLTNNPRPFINSMFQHYPSDYAVIQNRWTGRRTVVEVEPPDTTESTAPRSHGVVDRTPTTKPIYVNCLLDRVYLYVQKSCCVVQWDAAKELAPERFISKKLLHNVATENAFSSRATVAVRRRDQLLESPGTKLDNGGQPPKETLVKRLFTFHKQSKGDKEKQVGAAAAATPDTAEMPRVVVTSTVRAQDKTNGDVQGNLPAYEEIIKTTLQELLVPRYYECILRLKVEPGVSPVFAREMIANGTVDGTGVRWEDVVPSFEALEAEVRQRIESLVGNDIIIYDFHINCLRK